MSRKRIDYYTVKLVKEKGVLYEMESRTIRTPLDAATLGRQIFQFDDMTKEHFCILTLSTKNQIIGAHIIFVGSLNASIVHPREVYQQAILNNAASIVAYHNHPSGDPTPSREDIEVTERLKKAGEIIGIQLLDHVIIGDDERHISLREKGHC